jgi:hypothetical protein
MLDQEGKRYRVSLEVTPADARLAATFQCKLVILFVIARFKPADEGRVGHAGAQT